MQGWSKSNLHNHVLKQGLSIARQGIGPWSDRFLRHRSCVPSRVSGTVTRGCVNGRIVDWAKSTYQTEYEPERFVRYARSRPSLIHPTSIGFSEARSETSGRAMPLETSTTHTSPRTPSSVL